LEQYFLLQLKPVGVPFLKMTNYTDIKQTKGHLKQCIVSKAIKDRWKKLV